MKVKLGMLKVAQTVVLKVQLEIRITLGYSNDEADLWAYLAADREGGNRGRAVRGSVCQYGTNGNINKISLIEREILPIESSRWFAHEIGHNLGIKVESQFTILVGLLFC